MDGVGTIGFVGTGEIATAMIEGLAGAGAPIGPVVVSPRSAHVSGRLAARWPEVSVAADNRGVVNAADTVVVSVRPEQLSAALYGVTFRADQLVISVLAGVSIAQLREVVGPDVAVVRAIPLPAVSRRECVTVMTPPHPVAQTVFDALGGTLVLPSEQRFPVFSALTGACTGLLQYVETLCAWATGRGVPREHAEDYVRAMVASLAPALLGNEASMAEVIRAHETAGGLNEQLRLSFFDARTTDALTTALDELFDRVADVP